VKFGKKLKAAPERWRQAKERYKIQKKLPKSKKDPGGLSLNTSNKVKEFGVTRDIREEINLSFY
jgi:hypothetical protein